MFRLGVGVAVGEAEADGVAEGTTVADGVGVGVCVAEGVAVGEAVADGVPEGVAVGVGVGPDGTQGVNAPTVTVYNVPPRAVSVLLLPLAPEPAVVNVLPRKPTRIEPGAIGR